MLFFVWAHSLVFTHNVYDRQTRFFITMRMSYTIYFKHIKIQSNRPFFRSILKYTRRSMLFDLVQ